MKRIFIILLQVLLFGQLFATEQFSDKIIIEKDTFLIFNFENHIELNYRVTQAINEMNEGWECSGCYRGYIATWEIIEDKIYLVDIINYKDSLDLKPFAEKILKRSFKNGRIEATFVNDEFYCGLNPVGCGYGCRMSEKECKIKIKNGEVVEKEFFSINNCDYKYENEVFMEYIYKNINWDKLERGNYLVSIIAVVDKKGKVIDFKRGHEYFYDENIYNQLKSILLKLPCIQVYVSEGQFQPEIKFNLSFNDEIKEKYVR